MEKQGANIQSLLPGLSKLMEPKPGDTVFFQRRKPSPDEFEARLRAILELETQEASGRRA